MRHNKKFNHLGRTASHRSAMLSNMACSLIKHKRITTTVAKAKALKKFVEPLITKSKDDTTNSRRVVFSNLQDKIAVTELFKEISVKVAVRSGGYTRIIKTDIVWVITLKCASSSWLTMMKTWLRLQLLRRQLVLVVLRRVLLKLLLQKLQLQKKPLKLSNLYTTIYTKGRNQLVTTLFYLFVIVEQILLLFVNLI